MAVVGTRHTSWPIGAGTNFCVYLRTAAKRNGTGCAHSRPRFARSSVLRWTMCDRSRLAYGRAILAEAKQVAEERKAQRKLALEMIRLGYKELTKFGVSDDRARHLKAAVKQLKKVA